MTDTDLPTPLRYDTPFLISGTWQDRCFGKGENFTSAHTPSCELTCRRGCTAPRTSCPPAGHTPSEGTTAVTTACVWGPGLRPCTERLLPTSLCTSAIWLSTSTPRVTLGRSACRVVVSLSVAYSISRSAARTISCDEHIRPSLGFP